MNEEQTAQLKTMFGVIDQASRYLMQDKNSVAEDCLRDIIVLKNKIEKIEKIEKIGKIDKNTIYCSFCSKIKPKGSAINGPIGWYCLDCQLDYLKNVEKKGLK